MNSLVRLSVGFSLLTLWFGCATKPKDDGGASGTIEQNASVSTSSPTTAASKEKIKGGKPKQGSNTVHSGGVEIKKDASDASGAEGVQPVETKANGSIPVPISENPSSPDDTQKEDEPVTADSSNDGKQDDQVSVKQSADRGPAKTDDELADKDGGTVEPPDSQVENEPLGIAGVGIGEKPSVAKLPSPEQIKNDPESSPVVIEEIGNPDEVNSSPEGDSDSRNSSPGIDSFFKLTSPRDVAANADSVSEEIKPSVVTSREPGSDNRVDSPSSEGGAEVSIVSGKPELIPSGVSVAKPGKEIGVGLGFADPESPKGNSGKSLALSSRGIEPSDSSRSQSDEMHLSLSSNPGRSFALGLLAGKGVGFSSPGAPVGFSKGNQQAVRVGFADPSSRRSDSTAGQGINLGFSDKSGKARIPQGPFVRANQIRLAKTRSSNGRDYAFLSELFDFEDPDENAVPRSQSSSPNFTVIHELFNTVSTGSESSSLETVQGREGDRYEPVIEWLRLSGLIENAGE
ncbi:hypothetical protein OAK38_08840 [Verrucomicrobia bacterium]|nr:hypothetical protein [Verrucomicrobiota bacterium]